MYLTYDGLRIHAKLEKPDGDPERCPVCVVVHGLTGNMEERHIAAAAETLRSCGMATLRVDMYGHGKSDGDFAEHTLYKWLTQLLHVVDHVRALDLTTDIYLCGHSQGGLTAILAAGMLGRAVAGVIGLSPAIVITDGARKGSLLGYEFDPDDVPDVLEIEPWTLSGNYLRVAQTLDAGEAMARYRGPVLLVHGDRDQAVPVSYSVDAASTFDNAELVVIEGADHNYTGPGQLDQVLDAIRAWAGRAVAGGRRAAG